MKQDDVIVLGGQGQLARALGRLGLNCIGSDRLDLRDPDAIQAFFQGQGASARLVINAAAYTAVDKAESEPEAADALNHRAPMILAQETAQLGIPLIHISTDYVFDGQKKSPWQENDPIAPMGVYGQTKADGEAAIRRHNPRHIIVRTAWVFGEDGHNFVKTMLRLGASRDQLGVVADQHGCPTDAADIARACVTIAEAILAGPDRDLYGTYHYAGAPATTWHGFVEAIFDRAAALGAKRPQVNAITTADYPTPARRPANSVLDCARIGEVFGIAPSDWSSGLDRVIATLIKDAAA